MTDEVPFWKRGGFESFQAYLDEQERLRDLYEPRRSRRRSFAELPRDELGELKVPRNPPRSHQVNVKLRIAEWFDLCEAARDFGVAPSTLARLLVSRGIEVLASREPEA